MFFWKSLYYSSAHTVPKSGGEHSTFFQVGVRPRFPKCEACKLTLVNWNFHWGHDGQNLGKNWGCRGQNFQIFIKSGACELIFKLFCLKWDPCELRERHEKGVFRQHIPIPSLSSIVWYSCTSIWDTKYMFSMVSFHDKVIHILEQIEG